VLVGFAPVERWETDPDVPKVYRPTAVCEVLSRYGTFPPNWLPAPSVVGATAFDLAWSGELAGHILISVYRVSSGFFIGLVAATVPGALTGSLRCWM
jgi:sulfonate transport system permease protein